MPTSQSRSPSSPRRHAVLRPAPGGGVVIEDLGSANGTFIDGSRLTGSSRSVTTSATVTIGDTDIEIEMPDSARRADVAAPDDRTRFGAQVPTPVRPPAAATPLAAAASATPQAPAPGAAVSPSQAASPPPPETPNGRRPGDAGLPKRARSHHDLAGRAHRPHDRARGRSGPRAGDPRELFRREADPARLVLPSHDDPCGDGHDQRDRRASNRLSDGRGCGARDSDGHRADRGTPVRHGSADTVHVAARHVFPDRKRPGHDQSGRRRAAKAARSSTPARGRSWAGRARSSRRAAR